MNWLYFILCVVMLPVIVPFVCGVYQDIRQWLAVTKKDLTVAEQIKNAQDSPKTEQFRKCDGCHTDTPVSRLFRGHCTTCMPRFMPSVHPKCRINKEPTVRAAILKEDI